MADEINQKLGFDASGAIATLNQLDAIMRRFQSGTAGVSDQLKRFNGNSKQSTKNVKALTVSFETLARVVATQFIVRSLSRLRNEISQAFGDAIDFQRQVAEIATIAPVKDFDELAHAVRGVSDAFNLPLGDAGKGLYQVISNQVQGFDNQLSVLRTSAQFAKVSVASLNDSTNLLTGTINSFGKESSEAQDIAAKFFRTIELGRTTGSELANSFGRVSTIAGQVGIRLEELQAAFATVTIGGIKTSEAATQLRGVINALIKPTEEMKRALRQLGFESGEQAIAALGFQGALQAVVGTTDGSTTAIAELIPRVRGLSAALRLTGTGVENFQQNLAKIDTTTLETLATEFERVTSTDAEKVTRDFNKLRNFLTTELGTSLVETTGQVFDFIGGVDTLIGVGEAMVPVFGAAGLAAVAFGTKAAFAGIKARVLATEATTATKVIGGLAGALVAAGLAAEAGEKIGGFITSQLKEVETAQRQADARLLQTFRGREALQIAEAKQASDARRQIMEQEIAALRRLHFQNVDNARIADQQFVESTRDAAQRVLAIQSDRLRQIERIEKRSLSAVDESERRSISLRDKLSDDAFDRNARSLADQLTAEQQFQRFASRAREVAARAERQLSQATTRQQETDAIAQFDRAARFASQAEELARRSGNRRLEFRAAQAVRGVLLQQLDAERQLTTNQQRRASEAQQLADREARRLERLKTLATQLSEASTLFDQNGDPLSLSAQSERVRQFQRVFSEFQQEAFRSGNIDASQILGISTLGAQLSQQLGSATIRKLELAPGAIRDLQLQLFRTGVNLELAVKVRPDFEGEEVRRELERQSREFQFRRSQNESLLSANAQTIGSPGRRAFGLVRDRFFGVDAAEGVVATDRLVRGLNQEIIQLNSSAELTSERFEELFDRVQAFRGRLNVEQEESLGRQLQILQETLNLRNKLLDAERASGQVDPGRNSSVVPDVSEQSAIHAERLQRSVNGTEGPSRSLARNSLTAAVAFERIADAANRISLPRLSTDVAGLLSARGGPVARLAGGGKVPRFQAGGFAARGTDTIPAMLSPGEFVVNAKSTRQFFSQLVAMNAGVQPVFREQGGPVTNVGDINVTVQGGPTGHQSARSIATGVRRELRRGTSVL